MLKYIAQYLNAKIIISLIFGCANGIPIGLTISSLNAWLEVAGISKVTIGFFSLLGIPHILKLLWAPIIDYVRIPFLTYLIGQRRAWLISTQILLCCAIIKLACSNPLADIYIVMLLAFVISTAGAIQETITDTIRVEILTYQQQSLGATSTTIGYNIGLTLSGGGTLVIVDMLCKDFAICDDFSNWKIGYIIFAFVVFIASIASFFLQDLNNDNKILNKQDEEKVSRVQLMINAISVMIVQPFKEIAKHNKWVLILVFVMIYRTCDAFIAPMMNPFLLDIGFSLTEIGLVVKTFGLLATTLGSLIGGFLAYYLGVFPSLFICGLTQMFSNIMFIMQAKIGYNMGFLYCSIAAENIGGAMAVAVFMSYIAKICCGSKHIATQYSFLTGLSMINYFFAGSFSGWVVENFGWVNLFITSVVLGIPPLIILFFLRVQHFR